MRIGALLWLPVRVAWAAVKACALPALISLVAWWLLPADWARWVLTVMIVWAAIVLLLIFTKVSGEVRGLGRGPIYTRDWL